MKRLILIISATALILNVFAGDNSEAKRIFENAQKNLSLKDVILNLELVTTDEKDKSKSKTLIVSFAEFVDQKVIMIEFIAPENVFGTKILSTDYHNKKGIIEIYMPSTGKIQKIRANQQNLKIMGIEIPINQFNTVMEADFDISLLGKELLNGVQCHKLIAKKTDNKGFRTLFISVKDERLLRVEKYDLQNRLISRTELSDYIKVDNSIGKVYPGFIDVKNFKTGKSLRMKVSNVTYISKVNIEDFKLSSTAALIN